MRRILVMGLSGNGKTWLASRMSKLMHIPHWDADVVREIYKDWDFSEGGRIRQAYRMNSLASKDSLSIGSFICPTEEHRRIFDPEVVIWMDINKESEYKDTDNIFEPPEHYDIRITKWITRPTVQLLGRYQPWHDGHTQLFKRVIKRLKIVIMVRDTGEQYHNRDMIKIKLGKEGYVYGEDYIIMDVPNIVNITYGRDVGYKIEQEKFSEEIESISATEIRGVPV